MKLKDELARLYRNDYFALLLESERLVGWMKGTMDLRSTPAELAKALVKCRDRLQEINVGLANYDGHTESEKEYKKRGSSGKRSKRRPKLRLDRQSRFRGKNDKIPPTLPEDGSGEKT